MRTCKICKVKFQPQFNAVQMCCSIECAGKYTQDQNVKAWKKEKKKRKDDLKTHSVWNKELDEICQEIARLIDKDQPCISCHKPPKKKNGGHRFSKKAEPQLRHNLFNIFIQCEHCNSPNYGNGNPDGYDKGLEMYFGIEIKNEIHGLRQVYKTNKISIPELIQAKARAKKIVKELKGLDLVYPANVRIELRKEYNRILGIYS